jgi:hypothetical protein
MFAVAPELEVAVTPVVEAVAAGLMVPDLVKTVAVAAVVAV